MSRRKANPVLDFFKQAQAAAVAKQSKQSQQVETVKPAVQVVLKPDYKLSLPEWQRAFVDLVVENNTIVVRQSALNIFTECRRKYFYEYIADEKTLAEASVYPIRMLIGSVCHAIVAQSGNESIKAGDYSGLMDVIDSIRSKQKYDMHVDGNGHAVTITTEQLARKFFDNSLFWGYSLFQIANMARAFLYMQGYRSVLTEYEMSYTISNESHNGKIVISGTLDSLLKKDSEYVIADFKFGGLAKRLLTGQHSVKADSYSPLEITYSTQFGMYDFMLSKDTTRSVASSRSVVSSDTKPSSYMYIVPVAVVPTQTGKNKGQWRGELIHSASALTATQLDNYFYNNLIEIVRELSRCVRENIWPRSHPSIWGRLTCPGCRWKNECLGVSETKDSYSLDDPGYDMEE